MSGQTFCLKWEGFQTNVTSLLEELRVGDELVDVTLCCEGRRISAHRVLLSACSPYFREVLKNIACQHMVFYLKDTSFSDLCALIEFIYKGSVNLLQSQLPSFIKTAESLQIRGLSGDRVKNEIAPSAVYNEQPSNTAWSGSTANLSGSRAVTTPNHARHFTSEGDADHPLSNSISSHPLPMSSLLEPRIDIHCSSSLAASTSSSSSPSLSTAVAATSAVSAKGTDSIAVSPQGKRRRYNADTDTYTAVSPNVCHTLAGGSSAAAGGGICESVASKGPDSCGGGGVDCGGSQVLSQMNNTRAASPVNSMVNSAGSLTCDDDVAGADTGFGRGGSTSLESGLEPSNPPLARAYTECTSTPGSPGADPSSTTLIAAPVCSDQDPIKVEKVEVCEGDALDERDTRAACSGEGGSDPHLESTLGQVAQYEGLSEADHSILGTGSGDMSGSEYLPHQQEYMPGGEYPGGVAPIDYVPGSSHVVNILEDGTSQVSLAGLGSSSAPSVPETQSISTKRPDRFECRICLRSYSRRENLALHMHMHQGLTVCRLCHRMFGMVRCLREHLRVYHSLSSEEIDRLAPRRLNWFTKK